MNEQKLRGAIGLCARARKLACGDFAVKRSIQTYEAHLVLIDESASQGTKNRVEYLCKACGVECRAIKKGVGAAQAAGRDSCLVFSVLDENLAILVKRALEAPPTPGEGVRHE